LISFNKRERKDIRCPLCRKMIEEPKIKKMQFKGVELPISVPDVEMTEQQR